MLIWTRVICKAARRHQNLLSSRWRQSSTQALTATTNLWMMRLHPTKLLCNNRQITTWKNQPRRRWKTIKDIVISSSFEPSLAIVHSRPTLFWFWHSSISNQDIYLNSLLTECLKRISFVFSFCHDKILIVFKIIS